MAVTTKGRALMDTSMSRQSMIRAANAVTKNYKTFSFTVSGGLNDGKHNKGKKGIVHAIEKTIDTLKDPKKKLEFVTVRLTIHDSCTIFNYSEYSARYEQIKQELREYLGDAVPLHTSINHEKSYDFNVVIEGEVSEKEIWE